MVKTSQTQNERLKFIDFRLYFFGEISRSDLMNRFGISSASATRELMEYKNNAADNLEFNNVLKNYSITSAFKPMFQHDLEQSITAITKGFGDSETKSLNKPKFYETLPMFNRPDIEALSSITRAIHLKKTIKLKYSSFSSGASEREIVPFAIISDGVRWHVRAYCRKRKEFRDFVITRMEHVELQINSSVQDYEQPENDIQWNRIVELEIISHPKNNNPKITEKDFGMCDGILKIKMRAPIVGYMLRLLNVDCSSDRSMEDESFRLCITDPLALYGVESASFAPGYKASNATS